MYELMNCHSKTWSPPVFSFRVVTFYPWKYWRAARRFFLRESYEVSCKRGSVVKQVL